MNNHEINQLLDRRIVKYRVWDKENRLMIYPDGMYGMDMDPGTETIVLKIAGEMNNVRDEFQEQFELMQFTGLYDSDDREVYEGDIILFTDRNEYASVYWDQGGDVPDAQYCVKKIGGEIMDKKWLCYRYKVVGNIFESDSVTVHETVQF